MFSSRAIQYRGIVATAQSTTRFFHASPTAHKTVTEKVTEVADKVNKSVGKGLADVIDKGEKATYAAKDKVSSVTRDSAKRAKKEAEDTVKRQAVDRERQTRK